jgi:hypothetical protein
MAVFDSLAANSKLERLLLANLSRSIEQVLGSVAESDHIREVRGKAEALAFFESREDAMPLVKWQAEQLRIQIAGRIADRIRSARSADAVFHELLFPVRTTLESAAFVNFAHPDGGTLVLRYARTYHEH